MAILALAALCNYVFGPISTEREGREDRPCIAGLDAKMPSAQIRTLRQALEMLRTRERLASSLQISVGELAAYLTAMKPLPENLYIQAIGLVAARESVERFLQKIVSAMVTDRWIHQPETGLTLAEFQILYAVAEDWESIGRITILETREKAQDRGAALTVAIRLQRVSSA